MRKPFTARVSKGFVMEIAAQPTQATLSNQGESRNMKTKEKPGKAREMGERA